MITFRRSVSFLLMIIMCTLTFINIALAINYGGPIDLEYKLNDEEKLILQQVSDGKAAEMYNKKSGIKSEIPARFLEALLTGEFKGLNIHRHGVIIQNARILIPPGGKLDLKLAKVSFEVKFINCDFVGKVDFEDSQFDNNLWMEKCHFLEEANFIKMIVKKSAYFREAVFFKSADFSSGKIGISMNMESTTFFSMANFTNITIQENAYFGEHAVFLGPVAFYRANVGGILDFGSEDEGPTFMKGLDEEDGFKDLRVGSHLALRGAIVIGPAKFDRADIKGDLKFAKNVFLKSSNYASFPGVKVGHIADFEDTVFQGPVDFDGVEVGLELKAKKAKFAYQGEVTTNKLWLTAGGLKVGTIAGFEEAEFEGPVNFSGAHIGGMFNATKAKFNSKNPADFSGMKVGQLAQFTNVKFRGPVNFSGSKVGGRLTANAKEETTGIKFEGAVFGDSDVAGEVYFKDVHLTDLELQGTAATPLRISKLDLKRLHVDRDLSLEHATVDVLEAGSLQVDGIASFKDIETIQKIDLRYSKFGILELEWKGEYGPPKKEDLNLFKKETEDKLIYGLELDWKGQDGGPPKEVDLFRFKKETEDKLVLDGMVYNGLRPLDKKNRTAWINLINYSRLDTGNYKQMENYFLNLGYESEADQVFMEMRRRELEESSALMRGATWFFWGLLAGYGREPHRALLAGLLVIVIGAFFYSPMLLKEEIYKKWKWKGWLGTNERYKSWIIRLIFSLDQFLPAVNLGLAGELDLKKVTFGKLIYFHFHKIAGWVLILIGLAAITTRLK